MADGLRNVVFLHPETRDRVFQTARTGANCLWNPKVLAWVTPQASLPEFGMNEFVASKDTVYLMSKDTAGAAALLPAAFLDQPFDAAQDRAERHGGRLPVPLTAVLGEVGNIAQWTDCRKSCPSPAVSASRSPRSCRTGPTARRSGARSTWRWRYCSARRPLKLFGAGIDADNLAKRNSLLVDQHDAPHRSTTPQHGRPVGLRVHAVAGQAPAGCCAGDG